MTQQIHKRRVGDTLTALSVTLQQPNESGTLAAVNLTGYDVTFKMVNSADGTEKIAETSTGVTVVTAASGTVNYDFSASGVDEAGIFWGSFIATSSTETDHFPVLHNGLEIHFDSDTQSAKAAYLAAVEGA